MLIFNGKTCFQKLIGIFFMRKINNLERVLCMPYASVKMDLILMLI